MDVVVFSHLRWNFVFQRPQHLMTRAARDGRVLFIEEPEVEADAPPELAHETPARNVTVLTPRLPDGLAEDEAEATVAGLVRPAIDAWRDGPYVLWHYAVMAEPLSRGLDPAVTVYDCMDELAAFRHAPAALVEREARLLERADLVFTGGHALYDLKRERHRSVHAFPSSVDIEHFRRARNEQPEHPALHGIPHPRFIYAGVIDERIDLPLVRALAASGAGEVVMVGPTAKIEETELPRHPRIHYLGMRRYEELPSLFSHAAVGIMPFALNDATRYISPTKTPEYLAAGLPVVTTPVRDVVRGYGDLAEVLVAEGAEAFTAAAREAARMPRRWHAVDERLAKTSWDATWAAMRGLIETASRSGAVATPRR